MGDEVSEVEVGFRFDAGLELWDQQPGEPDGYYAWFQKYLSLPMGRTAGLEARPRRLLSFARELGVSERQLHRVCDGFEWVRRAAAWDVAHEERLRGEVFDRRVNLFAGQVGLLEELLGFSLGLLREQDLEAWRPRDVVELMKVVLVGQQQLLGLSGDAGGSFNRGGSVELPLGSGVGVVEEQLGEVWGELL